MYEQAQAASGAAGAGPDMSNMGGNASSSADDDVIDADFKEVQCTVHEAWENRVALSSLLVK